MTLRVALIALALATPAACSGATGGLLIIKRPNDGETFTSAATIIVSVEIAAPIDDASITQVDFIDEFFSSDVPRCSDAGAPYTCSWPVDLTENGAHTWTATAQLSTGEVWTSPAITVHVNITGGPNGDPPPGGNLGPARGVAVNGPSAYVASAEFGLTTIDVRDPSEPLLYASSVSEFSARTTAANGTRALALGESGDKAHFWLLDVTRGQAPPVLGELPTEVPAGTDSGNLKDVVLVPDGTAAIAALGDAGVYVIDLGNAAEPSIEGIYDTGGFANAISYDAESQLAYVADGTGGLIVLDLEDRSAPSPLPQEPVAGTVADVAVVGEVAYLLTEEGTLYACDIAIPASPALLDTVETEATGLFVAVWDQVAVLVLRGAGGDRIETYNVSNPEAIAYRGVSDAAATVTGFDLANARAYVAAGNEGLRIFNVQWPNPRLEGAIVPQ